MDQIKFLRSDIYRWEIKSFRDYFYSFFEQAIWATVLYRVSRILFLMNIPILKYFLRFAAFLLYKFSDIVLGAAIPASAEIGPGFYIGHCGCIRIHQDLKAGKNLSIGTGVIIGQKGLGTKGVPYIGDNVYIGVGAKLLGPIHIGNDAKIGANAVVVIDLPDAVTAVGVPAKIQQNKPSIEQGNCQ